MNRMCAEVCCARLTSSAANFSRASSTAPCVAEVSALANHDAMKNERVHVLLGDAREILLASHDRYDLVASEPSNPYRAGVASLFTREYYEAIANRLTEDGIFLQ